MNKLIDFYKGLDLLNLIIFWGIIIVIVLVIILVIILICKNKKAKQIEKNNNDNHAFEEIPIKKETIEPLKPRDNNQEETSSMVSQPEEKEETKEIATTLPQYENEHLIPEEETSKDAKRNSMLLKEENNAIEELTKQENKKYTSSPIEIPSKPYQRNVLKEMSLSQTSPIGINRPIEKEDKKTTMAKDLEDALNNEEINSTPVTMDYHKPIESTTNQINREIKNDLFNIKNDSYRKTEIKKEPIVNHIGNSNHEEQKIISEVDKSIKVSHNELENINIIENNNQQNDEELKKKEYNENASRLSEGFTNSNAKELLINNATIKEEQNENKKESYLEEVSRKLSNAETPNEIERTMYEIKQEEDAIISYKELMEKKDSIQTIDEEDAVISIEELMNKTSHKQEDNQEDAKLYNISENEENDNFIKELKQFRNDL